MKKVDFINTLTRKSSTKIVNFMSHGFDSWTGQIWINSANAYTIQNYLLYFHSPVRKSDPAVSKTLKSLNPVLNSNHVIKFEVRAQI